MILTNFDNYEFFDNFESVDNVLNNLKEKLTIVDNSENLTIFTMLTTVGKF